LTASSDKGNFQIEVSCYSGYQYGERPVSFRLLDRTFRVEEVLDRWYGEDHRYFKIRADDGKIYLLKYEILRDRWTLSGMTPSS
jgi:hypothetical protein